MRVQSAASGSQRAVHTGVGIFRFSSHKKRSSRARLPGPCRAKGKGGKSDDAAWQARKGALDAVMKDIEKQYGKGIVQVLGDEAAQAKVAMFPTGVHTLDLALGGGIPKGRIVEVYGPESSGKTTLAMHAIAEVQRTGGTAVLVDAEHAFDPVYSQKVGVDIEKLIIVQAEAAEEALEVVDKFARSHAVDIIVIDSVAALVPKAEIEGEMGSPQIGLQARLMSQALRRLNANASKCNCTVVFLNQLRQKVGVIFGNPEITSGGNALKFYSSVRLDIRRKETLRDSKNEEKGIKVRVKVTKNKVAPPYKIGVFDIMFDRGINKEASLLDVAEELEVVEKKGSWYSLDGTNIGQGRENTVQYLLENKGVYKAIEETVSLKLSERAAGGVPSLENVADQQHQESLFEDGAGIRSWSEGGDPVEDLAGQSSSSY
ncbi:RecA DNA recombinase [Chloropicon primus]|uniref:RecA DNA recombinase n=1 Tax=Chloropicon primus TaxID=1764295 RepID=A0A5B8MK47_9CHLO|nr:RecA DNA recombinase [Chloropicon primus]UPQ98971.1 RecA DNA recombinase [Chloropicon primus]|eukprot:QDZ19760.1 RecA DNA recombinase [Chloropicon primus]